MATIDCRCHRDAAVCILFVRIHSFFVRNDDAHCLNTLRTKQEKKNEKRKQINKWLTTNRLRLTRSVTAFLFSENRDSVSSFVDTSRPLTYTICASYGGWCGFFRHDSFNREKNKRKRKGKCITFFLFLQPHRNSILFHAILDGVSHRVLRKLGFSSCVTNCNRCWQQLWENCSQENAINGFMFSVVASSHRWYYLY